MKRMMASAHIVGGTTDDYGLLYLETFDGTMRCDLLHIFLAS